MQHVPSVQQPADALRADDRQPGANPLLATAARVHLYRHRLGANRYKPGWTDPTVSDAIPQLQAAGAQIGADAVIVRSDRSNNDRHVVVEGEEIKFTSDSELQRNVGTSH